MQPFVRNTLPAASALALALSLCAAPAWADSTSSASSAASTSVGSSSASLETSSASSSGKGQVAQGHYTVVDLTAVAGVPDLLRVRLQAAVPGLTPEFALLVPRQTVMRAHLTTGQTVLAQHRPYGLAFAMVAAHGAAHTANQPFFLVLDDAWHRELESRPVASSGPAATI